MKNSYQVAIIGGGIVGLATAYNLLRRFPNQRLVILEKEKTLAAHQTGHNSGVLHSGIYYTPGSLKAVNCRQGKKALEEFCRQEDVDFEICGKVIVAVHQEELPRLERIFERGKANGVRCEMINGDRLREIEPHAAGISAIHVPEAGIINFRQVCERLADHVRRCDSQIVTGARVQAMQVEDRCVAIESTAGSFVADYAVNCSGLHSDRVIRMSGQPPSAKIIPFRGEYYQLKPAARSLCRHLIYPVPDPSFPFLGVHFTRMIDGSVECGPNAVLAFAREGYRRRDINLFDLCDALAYRGFRKLARKYWRVGLGEMWRSASKAAFVRALQRLMPEIRADHLEPAPAGVRAQAVSQDGNMVDDFLIQEHGRMIHVGNAPSPAATSSLNIGKTIVEKLAEKWR